jgi:hypothetical protein
MWADDANHGFDNMSDALRVSPALLEGHPTRPGLVDRRVDRRLARRSRSDRNPSIATPIARKVTELGSGVATEVYVPDVSW